MRIWHEIRGLKITGDQQFQLEDQRDVCSALR